MQHTIKTQTRRRAATLGAVATIAASLACAANATTASAATGFRPPGGVCPAGTFDLGGICADMGNSTANYVKNEQKNVRGTAMSAATTAAGTVSPSAYLRPPGQVCKSGFFDVGGICFPTGTKARVRRAHTHRER